MFPLDQEGLQKANYFKGWPTEEDFQAQRLPRHGKKGKSGTKYLCHPFVIVLLL